MIEPRGGVWWTDNDFGKRVPGTLTRVGDVWQLDLIGRFPESESEIDSVAVVPPTTVYGSSRGTRYTLHHAYLQRSATPGRLLTVPPDERDRGEDQYSQRWNAYALLKGDALPRDILFTSAQFELNGLSAWWPHGNLRRLPTTASIDDEWPPPTIADCGDGVRVTISILPGETHGTRSRTLTARTVMWVDRHPGFTFDEFFDVILPPLRGLLSILMHGPVEVINLQLQPSYDWPAESRGPLAAYPIEVDPGVIDGLVDSEIDHWSPTFTAEAVDPAALISRWVRLASSNRVPLDVAAPRKSPGPLQFEAVAVVNAAETLHRTLHGAREGSLLADRVGRALKAQGGFNARERSKIVSALRHQGVTLERRLLDIAEALGDGAGAWMLNDQVAEWAKVAAAVRNALSHGFPTEHRVEQDHRALVGVLRSTQAVIRLRLLVEAGVPSGSALVTMLRRDDQYVALRQQSLADWRQLAASIRTTTA